MLFANPVDKVETMLNAMRDLTVAPECECFDTGIVRSIRMFEANGMLKVPTRVPASVSRAFVLVISTPNFPGSNPLTCRWSWASPAACPQILTGCPCSSKK